MMPICGKCLTKWCSLMMCSLQLDWTPVRRTREVYLPTKQKGYGKSEIMYGKLLAERIQICLVKGGTASPIVQNWLYCDDWQDAKSASQISIPILAYIYGRLDRERDILEYLLYWQVSSCFNILFLFIFIVIGFLSPKLAIIFAQLCTNQNVTISQSHFCTVMGSALGFLYR